VTPATRRDTPAAPPFARLSDGLVALLVAEIVVIAFFPALRAGFVSWDDDTYLLGNPYYRGLGAAQLRWMFTVMSGHYMPVTWLTHGLDYVLWGMRPAGYHAVSLLLHALAAAAAYFVALRVLGAAVAPEPRGALRFAAAVAALLFAVHPLRVESVAWISERRDVLCGLFFLLAILCYLRAVEDGGAARPRWYWAAVALAALALLSKAMAVTLPLVLLLLDVYPLRRIGPWRWARREVWLEKLPFVVLSVAASVVAVLAQRSVDTLSDLRTLGVFERLGLAAYALVFYAAKTLMPTGLAPLYEAPYDYGTLTPWFAASAVVVVAGAVAAIRLRRRWPGVVTAVAAFVVLLLPVLGLVHFGMHIVADRNTYFAGLAPAMLAGAGVLRLLRGAPSPAAVRATRAAALVTVALLAVLTWRQSTVWHDSRTLWEHALRVSPSSIAHAKVGALLEDEGRTEEAIVHFREAVRLHPDNAYAHNNWGIALGNVWRYAEAIAHFEAALRIRPTYAEAQQNLAATQQRIANPLGFLEAQRAARERLVRGRPQ
jgi:tetratricopeptide (TPR) repeat protein